jgi:hypothetical protein
LILETNVQEKKLPVTGKDGYRLQGSGYRLQVAVSGYRLQVSRLTIAHDQPASFLNP